MRGFIVYLSWGFLQVYLGHALNVRKWDNQPPLEDVLKNASVPWVYDD